MDGVIFAFAVVGLLTFILGGFYLFLKAVEWKDKVDECCERKRR